MVGMAVRVPATASASGDAHPSAGEAEESDWLIDADEVRPSILPVEEGRAAAERACLPEGAPTHTASTRAAASRRLDAVDAAGRTSLHLCRLSEGNNAALLEVARGLLALKAL